MSSAISAGGGPSLRLRRSGERGGEDFGWTDNWLTFSFPGDPDPEWAGFGPLRVMVENHIQPRSGFPAHPHREVEIVTYVAGGTLTHADSFGHRAEVSAGEMQLISAGSRGMVHSEENLHDEVEHNYQMWLVPERPGTSFGYYQKKFTAQERQGRFRLYVSPDGREGSMPINTDARILAGLFSPGDRVEHALEPGRGAWLQVVRGELRAAGAALRQGDGIGVAGADRLELEVDADSDLLLFDVRMDTPMIWR